MKLIPKGVTLSVCRTILVAKKNSPHIFFAGGVVGIIGAGVLACRATLKLEEKLDDIKEDIDAVAKTNNTLKNNQQTLEHHKDVGYVAVKSVLVIGRLYGPSVLVGAVSVAALTGSHIQLTRRNAALSATLALVSKAYDDYRVRVQNEIGTERELDIHRAITKQEVEGKDGKKKLVKVVDPNGLSQYARFFDETCPNWQKDVEFNRIFIQVQQQWANNKLHARGHVFLNEVYDALGFERTRAGAVVGWVMDCSADSDSDNYIDFGLFEASSNRFVNKLERSIILDFNVDGEINEKI